MTTVLWILGIVLLVKLLLGLLRVGVLAAYEAETLTVDVTVAALHFRVVPAKAKKEKKEKKRKKETGKEKKREKEPPKKPTLRDLQSAAKALWPPLKRALGKTRRGVRVDPLDVSLVLGGRDEPADAAERYGQLQGAVWSVMPHLERLLVIPHPRIHTDVDFTAERTHFAVRAGLSARVGTLVAIGFTIAFPALRWYLAYRKQTQERKDDTHGNGKEEPVA